VFCLVENNANVQRHTRGNEERSMTIAVRELRKIPDETHSHTSRARTAICSVSLYTKGASVSKKVAGCRVYVSMEPHPPPVAVSTVMQYLLCNKQGGQHLQETSLLACRY